MTTILTAIRRGHRPLVCDAKCYAATNQICNCICQGLNHGAGKKAAQRHSNEQFTEISERLQTNLPGFRYAICHIPNPNRDRYSYNEIQRT